MSKDRHGSKERRLKILSGAASLADRFGAAYGIPLNCERGMAFENRDLQRLLREGLLELKRPRVGDGNTRLTIAVITSAGRRALSP